jgi:hypothetical protein
MLKGCYAFYDPTPNADFSVTRKKGTSLSIYHNLIFTKNGMGTEYIVG